MPPKLIEGCFLSQSVWDDTMAYTSVEYMNSYSEAVLVIIAGDFHVAYNGGLPDRLEKRGITKLITISQVNFYNLKRSERKALIQPHADWGIRADYIWISNEKQDNQ